MRKIRRRWKTAHRWKCRSRPDRDRRTPPTDQANGRHGVSPAGRNGPSRSPAEVVARLSDRRPASRPTARSADEVRTQSQLGHPVAFGVEELVQLGIADHAGKAVELAVAGDFGGDADEGVHGDAGKRTADADAAHAHGCEIAHGEAECATVEEMDRLWRCCLDV